MPLDPSNSIHACIWNMNIIYKWTQFEWHGVTMNDFQMNQVESKAMGYIDAILIFSKPTK